MFDFIKCEYPLPLPEEASNLNAPPDWKKIEFQTESFNRTLESYTIEEDGSIYKDITKRILQENSKGDVSAELLLLPMLVKMAEEGKIEVGGGEDFTVIGSKGTLSNTKGDKDGRNRRKNKSD